jgi:cytochrome b561
MQIGDTKHAYGWAAIALHWAIVIAVVAMLVIGLQADAAGKIGDRAARGEWMGLHIGLGFFVVLLVAARLYWSVTQPKPDPMPQAPWLQAVSVWTHRALLLGLAMLVISGPLAVWSGGRAIDVFGLFALPSPFAARDEGVHEIAEIAHAIGRLIVFVGVSLHVAGTLKHLVIDRDRTLQRMLWVRKDG